MSHQQNERDFSVFARLCRLAMLQPRQLWVDARQVLVELPPASVEEAHCPTGAVPDPSPAHHHQQLHFSDGEGRLDHLAVEGPPALEVSHLAVVA